MDYQNNLSYLCDDMEEEQVICQACGGSGYIEDELDPHSDECAKVPCQACDGTGYEPR